MPKVLLLVVVLVVAAVALVVLGIVKNPLSPRSSDSAEIELKTEYTNPFDDSTQYTNPFDEYQNPFDSLE